MYKYTWDEETGGLLLLPELSKFSKEPRPVYYKELDILGFDKYWNYPKDDHAPLLWAEANNYIYKGCTIAKVTGGALYAARSRGAGQRSGTRWQAARIRRCAAYV